VLFQVKTITFKYRSEVSLLLTLKTCVKIHNCWLHYTKEHLMSYKKRSIKKDQTHTPGK